VLFDVVVVVAGVTGAEMESFSRVRGSIGWGGVGGCVHVISRLAEAGLRDWGKRFNRGLEGNGVGTGVSLLVPLPTMGTSWADWSNTWGREMALRRALERLNLEYPANSS
jgi:hypothetical protein